MIKFAIPLLLMSVVVGAQTVPAVTVMPETAINTAFQEYSPAFYENGLVFISSNPAVTLEKELDEATGKSTTSIFLARRGQDGKLQLPVPFAEALTSRYYDGPLTFSARNDEVFFTRNNLKNGRPFPAQDGKVKLKIYASNKKSYSWTKIKDLPFNSDEFDTAHPTISIDGQKLYFASNRPEGFGGMDLWVCTRQGEGWSKPLNLGRTINTSKNEFFPFIHADGTLFFASDGHGGEGGLDIFYTQELEHQWNKPVNIGMPINSDKDDFGLIVDADMKNGYFSSNRLGGKGDDDIYSFHAQKGLFHKDAPKLDVPTLDVTIASEDFETGKFVNGMTVSYLNMADVNNAMILTDTAGNIIGFKALEGNEYSLDDFQSKETNIELKPNQWLKLQTGRYIFRFSHPDFKPQYVVKNIFQGDKKVWAYMERREDKKVATTESPQKKMSSAAVVAEKMLEGVGILPMADFLIKGSVIRLDNIYYNFNDVQIRPDANKTLKELVKLMQQHPEMEIELASHTDSRGSEGYNLQLSRQRAENLAQYLYAYSIDSHRVKPVGYGESQLKNHCKDGVECSEKEHRINRRTEVRILKIDPKVRVQTPTTAGVKVSKDTLEGQLPKIKRDTMQWALDTAKMFKTDSTRLKAAKNKPEPAKTPSPKKSKNSKQVPTKRQKTKEELEFERVFGPPQ